MGLFENKGSGGAKLPRMQRNLRVRRPIDRGRRWWSGAPTAKYKKEWNYMLHMFILQ